MLNNSRLQTQTEELLGLRGQRDNHAVRFKDVKNLKTGMGDGDLDFVKKVAEDIAREVAEGYDGANVDLSQLQAEIDAAKDEAAQAAQTAQNALIAAQGHQAYADSAVTQAKADMAVDFAAAQAAAYEALESSQIAQSAAFDALTNSDAAAVIKGLVDAAKEEAEGARDVAGQYSGIATQAANAAGNSATASQTSASLAESHATDSETSAAAAEASRISAASEAADAESYRIAAAASATTATQSASTASTQAGIAANAATNAGNSATAAQQSRSDASGFANAASSSATASNSSRLAAEAARDDARGFAGSAGVARDEAVTAKQDAESAAAAAEVSLDLSSEIAGRGFSVLNDQFLVSSDWTRTGGQGGLFVGTNIVYPIGRSWRFATAANQTDGIGISNSPDTIWTGQQNADGYAVEVEYTLNSGGLRGAAIWIEWRNTTGQNFYAVKLLHELEAGAGPAGKPRVARCVIKRPANFTGTFSHHNFYVFSNHSGLSGVVQQATTITFHRINLRAATQEELGSGEVMATIGAYLSENYLTSADTSQAIANYDITLNSHFQGVKATAERTATTLASLNGSVARFKDVVTVDGKKFAGIEAVAWDNGTGQPSSTVVQLRGDEVIADGTLSAPKLVVHDGSGNLVINGDFRHGDFRAWRFVHESMSLIERNKDAGSNAVRFAPTQYVMRVLDDGIMRQAYALENYDCKEGDVFSISADIAGGGVDINFRWAFRFSFFDAEGNTIGTPIERSDGVTSATWKQAALNDVVAPAGTARLGILNIRRVGGGTGYAFITNIVLIKKRTGETLITPFGVTASLISGDTMKALNGRFGSLFAANITVGNGEITTAKIDDAAITTAKIGNLAVDGNAHIKNLSVDRIKIANGSVTVLEYSFTAAATSSGPGHNAQQLAYTIGRSGPQSLDLHFDYTGGSPNYRMNVRVIRTQGGNSPIVFSKQDIIIGSSGTYTDRFTDTANLSGNVLYGLEVSFFNPVTGGVVTSTSVRNRYLGALNAYK